MKGKLKFFLKGPCAAFRQPCKSCCSPDSHSYSGFLLLVREVFGSTVVALGAVVGTVLVATLGAVSVAAWCHDSKYSLIICET